MITTRGLADFSASRLASTTAATSFAVGREKTMKSVSKKTSASEATGETPPSAARVRRASERSKPLTAKPSRASVVAMPSPMAPNPTTPTVVRSAVMIFSTLVWF
ncbi:hypothetical protein D9M68_770170 [compost metagenome]